MGKTAHFSANKVGVDQIPVEMLMELGLIYTYGEGKYARDNWKEGTAFHEFYGSAMRHMLAFWSGEARDPESGRLHLAHAIWNLTTLMYYDSHELGDDDREIWYGDDVLDDEDAQNVDTMNRVRASLLDITQRVEAFKAANPDKKVKP